MATKNTTATEPKKKLVQETTPQPKVVGKVEMKPIGFVKKNTWNPNRFTKEMLASLKHGLLTDGWLISQSLLVWGTDEKGKVKNIIIDGEHRWQVAMELGFKDGPMVFLHGLTEAQAKALTVKMDSKRGRFDEDLLMPLLRDLQPAYLDASSMVLDLGLDIERAVLAFAVSEPLLEPPNGSPPTTGTPSIQLKFTKKAERDKVKSILAKRAYREDEPSGDVLHRTLKELKA